jgi:hypothetical protein
LVEREHGFRPSFTHQAISGLCQACHGRARRRRAATLTTNAPAR